MPPEDVLNLYDLLQSQNIPIWIDGGWGVDALLGHQTRPHKDLDIAMNWNDVPRLRQLLAAQGYAHSHADNQWNFVLCNLCAKFQIPLPAIFNDFNAR
jgi:lincosamide nucleotidyltransferase A/C/D/E